MAIEGQFPKIDGDIFYASELNNLGGKIQQVYTGAGFDSTQPAGGVATDTQDHELDVVTDIRGATFVKVKITGLAVVSALSNISFVNLKAQIKEIGQSYSDIEPYTNIIWANITSIKASATYETVATLTSGMKTNGFQIKVFSQSTTSNGENASFTNIQTIQELS